MVGLSEFQIRVPNDKQKRPITAHIQHPIHKLRLRFLQVICALSSQEDRAKWHRHQFLTVEAKTSSGPQRSSLGSNTSRTRSARIAPTCWRSLSVQTRRT